MTAVLAGALPAGTTSLAVALLTEFRPWAQQRITDAGFDPAAVYEVLLRLEDLAVRHLVHEPATGPTAGEAPGAAVVAHWTGRHASALRQALRLTNEAFAEQLGTAVRTVAKWNADEHLVPVIELQRALDTALEQAPASAQTRFLRLTAESPRPAPAAGRVLALAPTG